MPSGEILPREGERNILITSALPYVNNVPHLGNIIGSVLSADVFSRYCKGRGYPTLFVCGTDEYGTATETKAIEEKITPQQLCDKYYAIHSEVYSWFNIGFDIFGRTPTKQQTEIAQDIFTKLYQNGYLEERTTTQPYCEEHKAFLADRFVEGECPRCQYNDARGDQCDKCGTLLDPLELKNPRCKLDGATPQPRETKHTFILLDKLQPQVEEWVKKSSRKGTWSSNGINITETWLKEGLKPRGITRDLQWGTPVPLPGYENKVMYVWFDACIGYVSITANYTAQWEKWWRDPDNVQLYQFLGKDNVPFHTVVFPASQIGTRDTWTQLHHLSTTEYLNYEGGKFSKSRGIGVFGTNAKETGVPSDVWRYYLLNKRPENGDSEFEWKAFIDANNNELLKNLGNFVNRVVKFVNSRYDGVVPEFDTGVDPYFKDFVEKDVNPAMKEYVEAMEAVKIKAGLASVLQISALGNKLLQDNRLDNKLAESEPRKCAAVVGLALNLVLVVAAVVSPYMPSTSVSILQQLNLARSASSSETSPIPIPNTFSASAVKPGHRIGEAAYLFTQIKAEKEREWRERFGGDEAKRAKEEKARKTAEKKAAKKDKKTTATKKKKMEEGGGDDADDGADAVVAAAPKPVEQAEKKELDRLAGGVEKVMLQTS